MTPLRLCLVTLWASALCGFADLRAEPSSPAADLSEGGSSGAAEWGNERDFWSFQPPVEHALPAVRDASWPRQRIDYFILARLEERGLRPSPPASRETLIRRLSYDLTGLPPDPETIEAFVADPRPDAYARWVERWLQSPQFGERLASLWLPLARYAEDQAHQVGDDTTLFYPNAHRYREWVIQAFNRDLPYPDFIRLQLAADKYETAPADWAALGFLGLGPKYYNRNRLEVKADEWEDRVDAVTRTFLGLTVACARCHDHQTDPIPTEDYYALAGVFASTRMVNKTPEGKVVKGKVSAAEMPANVLHIVEDGEPQDLNVFIRGQHTRPGPVAERHFLSVLSPDGPAPLKEGSGRRELAEQIASGANPLTARVMVNRVWSWFFGQGLVSTPSNFGRSGTLPTHPELLDDLAVRFARDGGSIKALAREILLSSAYQQASMSREEGRRLDPGNALLWRMPRRRLSVEQWRDTTLRVSGELETEGGRSRPLSELANRRRTVYGRVSRLELDPLFLQFDYPDANVHAEKRSVTTTATQKLFFLNNPFVIERARAFAGRLLREVPDCDASRVERAYRLALGRGPDAREARFALEFLEGGNGPSEARWARLAHALLISNELLYVD